MSSTMNQFLTQLRSTLAGPEADADLLRAYAVQRDEGAFRALVARHGPMVYGVCRRVLGPGGDPEDAFQATFLALARQAGAIRRPEALAGWLYRTAHRVARRARASAGRREQHAADASAAPLPAADPLDALLARELLDALDAELARLPERLQLPLVLCYWHGLSRAEAARRLGWPAGTLHGRLERGRARLAEQLGRRGLGRPLLLIPMALAPRVPAGLAARAVALARAPVGSQVPAAVAVLAGAVTPAVPRVVAVAAAALLALPLLVAGFQPGPRPPSPPPARVVPDARQPPRPASVDAAGDPLPARAVARLGTHRFRSDGWADCVVVVPGGRQFLTRGRQAAILWDAASGQEVRRFAPPPDRHVEGTIYPRQLESFAVTPDGKLLAAGTTDGSKLLCPILLFDLATGAARGELPGHPSNGFSATDHLAFLGPTLLASAGSDGSIRLWDTVHGREVRRLESPKDGHVSALVPASDGHHLFVAGGDQQGGYWAAVDIRTGRTVHRVTGLPQRYPRLALAPDGKTVAVIGGVGEPGKEGGSTEVRIHVAPDWTEQRRWIAHTGAYPQRAAGAFSPDGRMLVTGGADHTVRRWDSATGKEIGHAIEPYRHANDVVFLDAATLATFGAQNAIRFWNPATGRPKREFAGSQSHLTAVAYSPDGRHVATGGGGGDASVRVWDVASGKQVARLTGPFYDLTRVAFSPDGRRIATADSGGFARLWDWAAGREVRALGGHKGWVQALAFAPDGARLATGDQAGVVRVWDTANGRLVHTLIGHRHIAAALVFAPDGATLFSGGWDHAIRQWNLTSGQTVRVIKGRPRRPGRPTVEGHTAPVTGLALAPDGRRLFSASLDHTLCVWEVASGRLCRTLKGPTRDTASGVQALALSPDGRRLAAAVDGKGWYGRVHVWDVLTGERLAALSGHRGDVTGLAFAPDGKRLASCSTDTTALVWDVTALSAAPRPRSLEGVWDALGAEAPAAYDAVCRAILAGDAGVAVLRKELKPAAAVDAAQVARLVGRLDDDRFRRREEAARGLSALGLAAAPLLRRAAGQTRSAETRARLERLLAGLAADRVRAQRAVEVLEGTPSRAARALLAELAGGLAEASLTREAKASLRRLDRRRP